MQDSCESSLVEPRLGAPYPHGATLQGVVTTRPGNNLLWPPPLGAAQARRARRFKAQAL
jgi:hypothetical protein